MHEALIIGNLNYKDRSITADSATLPEVLFFREFFENHWSQKDTNIDFYLDLGINFCKKVIKNFFNNKRAEDELTFFYTGYAKTVGHTVYLGAFDTNSMGLEDSSFDIDWLVSAAKECKSEFVTIILDVSVGISVQNKFSNLKNINILTRPESNKNVSENATMSLISNFPYRFINKFKEINEPYGQFAAQSIEQDDFDESIGISIRFDKIFSPNVRPNYRKLGPKIKKMFLIASSGHQKISLLGEVRPNSDFEQLKNYIEMVGGTLQNYREDTGIIKFKISVSMVENLSKFSSLVSVDAIDKFKLN